MKVVYNNKYPADTTDVSAVVSAHQSGESRHRSSTAAISKKRCCCSARSKNRTSTPRCSAIRSARIRRTSARRSAKMRTTSSAARSGRRPRSTRARPGFIGDSKSYAARSRRSTATCRTITTPNRPRACLAFQYAIQNAGSLDPLKVRDALAALDVVTFYGILKFDSRGINVYKPMAVNQIQNGELMTVWPIGVQNAKPMYPTPRRGTSASRLDLFWQDLVNGILAGGIFAVVALGFSLVWGIMNIINLAHGAFDHARRLHRPTCCSRRCTSIRSSASRSRSCVLFAFGYCVQRFVINFVVRAPILTTFLLTFGLSLLIVNVALLVFHGDIKGITTSYSGVELRARPGHGRVGEALRRSSRRWRSRRSCSCSSRARRPAARFARWRWTSTPRSSRACASRISTRSCSASAPGSPAPPAC